MLTREEVAAIIIHCKDHKQSYKSRLEELGIPSGVFFYYKNKYAQEDAQSNGEFLQLTSKGDVMPSFAAKFPRKNKQNNESQDIICIELQMPNGALMRLHGAMTPEAIRSIIQSSASHV